MAAESNISWTDSTFNPWVGCTKVSPGCEHCYAEVSTVSRTRGIRWGAGSPRQLTSPANWQHPRRWNAAHADFLARHGRRQRVFCSSLADVLDNEAPVGARARLLELIRATPNLDWMLLTKRIGNAERMFDEALAELGLPPWRTAPWHNVWLGATIVNQDEANRDIQRLLAVPAVVHFLSLEPLLGPVWLCLCDGARYGAQRHPFIVNARCPLHGDVRVDWVIVGGESGSRARPMDLDWARSLKSECDAARVAFLFKQAGGRDHRKGGDLLDGRAYQAWPQPHHERIEHVSPDPH